MRQHHRPRSGAAATAALGLAADRHSVNLRRDGRGVRESRTGRAFAAAALVGVLAACSSGSTGPSGNSISAIVISPDSISLSTGATSELSARARTQSGGSVSPGNFFWSTSDSLVATVSQSGVVVAHEPGAAQIGASADGMSGFARVIVVLPVVKSVVITPASDTIYAGSPGDTAKLSAVGYDAAGHVIPGSSVLWSTGSGLASVSGGTVVGTNTGAGKVTITATSPDSGNAVGTASVLVRGHVANVALSPSAAFLSTSSTSFDTVRVSATLTDTFNNDVTGQRPLSWSTSDPTIATVDSHGLVKAISTAIASAQITATTPDGASGVMTVDVFP